MSDDWYSWIVVSSVRLLMFEPCKWDDDTHQFVFLGWVEPSTSMFKECSCSFCRLWWSTLSWQCLRLICSKLWVHNSYIFHWAVKSWSLLMPGFIIMCFIMFHRKRVMLVSPPIFREYGDFLKCQKWGVPRYPKSSKIRPYLYISIETYGDFGIPHFKKHPHTVVWFSIAVPIDISWAAQKMQPFLPTDPDKQSLSETPSAEPWILYFMAIKKRQFLAMMQPAATLW